jgi:TonB-linked SusC/RagA family outer membrane protein
VRRLLPAILLAPVAVVLSAWSFALPFQDGEEKVTIKGNGVPLLTVFKTIKKQAGYNFFYAANFVDDKEKVNLDVKNARVEDVLQKVLGSDYTWVYNENAVSITKKKEEVRRSSLLSVPDSSVTQITVSGAVTDAKGSPIPGATVMVKGTKDGASTDANGNFSLPGVAVNAVLVISSVGFEKREVQVKGKTLLAKLNVSVNDLDEAVVVAYGNTTQRKNVGAITVIKGETIENLPNRSFDRSLQGQIPGLLVTSGNGQPGGGLSNFVLRGIGTGTNADFGSTVRNPLVVIDGIPVIQDHNQYRIGNNSPINNPLAQLNPNDIESISVLKDASAIALYGSKASNGVILITTKKGREGKQKISFRHQTDVAERMKGNVSVLSQKEYLELLYESYKNSDPATWTDQAISNDLRSKFPYNMSSIDTSFYPPPNWFNELYSNPATITNEISFSGGSSQNIYFLNFEYTTQNGVLKNTGYDRASVRFNIDNRPKSWLKVGLNSTFSYNKQKYSGTSDGMGNLTGLPYTLSPLNPIRLQSGRYHFFYEYGIPSQSSNPVSNPVASAEYNINRINTYRGLGNIHIEAMVSRFITLSSILGIDFMLSENKEKVDPRLSFGGITPGTGSIDEWQTRRTHLITTNILRYDRIISNNHSFNIVLGQEAQATHQKTISLNGIGLSLPYFNEVSNAATVSAGAGVSKESLLSFFGQVNYSFLDKYLFSGSVRRDGSSKFGLRERYGNYWSTGIGWILTEEKFMKKLTKWIDYAKLRGSMGTSGNSAAINSNTRFDRLLLDNYTGYIAVRSNTTPGNEDIQWEETFNIDGGFEAKFLNGRIDLTADVYKRKISNLIYSISLSPVTGYSDIVDNIGNMENRGVEISVNIEVVKRKDFRWNLSANWSTNKNKLIKANVPLAPEGNLVNMEGENFNSFYLVRWAGVNKEDGKPQWLDSTGKITNVYNITDRIIVGKPQPDGFGGLTSTFNFKNFQLSALFYYQYGFKIYDNMSAALLNDGALYPYINQSKQALDRWRSPGDIAPNPRRILNNADGGRNSSTRYLFDGDFIRLKNVSLSYVVPRRIIDNLKLSEVRVYIQAFNLATLTKFKGLDPENAAANGNSAFSYPQQKTYSFGVNVSL